MIFGKKKCQRSDHSEFNIQKKWESENGVFLVPVFWGEIYYMMHSEQQECQDFPECCN